MPKKAKYIKGEKKIRRRSIYRTCIPIIQQRKIDFKNKHIDPTYKPSERFLGLEDPISERAYHYYRVRAKNPLTFPRWKRFMKRYFKTIKKHLVNNVAGVFIENFGYFMVTKSFKKRLLPIYQIAFIAIRRDSKMNTWCLDGAVNKWVAVNVYQKRNKGHKYKIAFSILQNLYGRVGVEMPEKRIKNDNK